VGWLSVGTTDRHQKKSREVYFANGCCVGKQVLKITTENIKKFKGIQIA
jgi:hypothetical protein